MWKIWPVLLSAALAAGACGSDDGDDAAGSAQPADSVELEGEPIVLGFAIGETGFMEPYDVPARTAAEMAIEEVNANGGVNGRPLRIVSADTQSEPEQSANAAIDVLDQGADIVVTSCDFDQGGPAALVAQERGVLALSTCAASTEFGPSGIGPLAFTMATAAPAEGATMAEWAFEEQGWDSAYVLVDDTINFTVQTTFGFENRFEELGGDVVGRSVFKQEDQSIATQINQIRALDAEPDVLWISSYNPGLASALLQLRSAGLDMPIVSDEDMDGDYWKEAVPDISNVYYATYGSIYADDPDEVVNTTVERYSEQEGQLPDTSLFLTGYALVEAVAAAVANADGSTVGADLQEAMEEFSQEDFLLPTSFSPKDHITYDRTLRIIRIENGESSFHTLWTPDSVPVP